MSIGEVLGVLTADFPDVSISKIRYLEGEGLVEPARTPSGYRKFTQDDVERLRYVMTLQRDHFWPLRKIRDHLDAVHRGAEQLVAEAHGPRSTTRPAVPRPEDNVSLDTLLRSGPAVRLSAAELCQRAGLEPSELDDLVGFGLLQPNGAGWYDAAGLAIATAAGELSRYGIEARHLRAFRTSADRAVSLVDQVVSPLRSGRGDSSRARADDTAREITVLALRLHAALLRAGLARTGTS